MIRYTITEDELRARIESQKPGWLARANVRTSGFVQAGRYSESSNIWGEIKRVYMRLQHDKCAYCERQLADSDDGGTIEHDVEHFRPKNTAPQWPRRESADDGDISFSFDLGDQLDNGYFWLAYHPMNYCTACKKCNSPLKSNYFPIAESRGTVAEDPAALNATEKPFLIYPIGELDEDPEELITFDGVNPLPVKRNGPRWRRAMVTIKFFALDRREELWRERARCLVALDNALRILDLDPADVRAQGDVERLRAADSPHASCVRAACAAYIADPTRMIDVFNAARDYLDSEHA